ncbi:MAG: hypothetical protein LBF23_02200, partial [Endomicrobium sp.]|nr:hypothetical protein [Endomicrobium sp.]
MNLFLLNNVEFIRGKFRIKGDTVEISPNTD